MVRLVGVGWLLRKCGVDDRDFCMWWLKRFGVLRFSSDLKGDVWIRSW
jgi:hypothetical protein